MKQSSRAAQIKLGAMIAANGGSELLDAIMWSRGLKLRQGQRLVEIRSHGRLQTTKKLRVQRPGKGARPSLPKHSIHASAVVSWTMTLHCNLLIL